MLTPAWILDVFAAVILVVAPPWPAGQRAGEPFHHAVDEPKP